jgi:hypothetical protein
MSHIGSRLSPLGRRTRRPSITTSTALLGFAAAATVLGAAACGSSQSSYNTSSARPDITSVYTTLFKLASSPVSTIQASVEDGPSLRSAIGQAVGSPQAKLSGGAQVTSVGLLSSSQCSAKNISSPCASVTYNILGTNGAALLTGQKGYAVYSNGKWLVAKSTVCDLLLLLYTTEGKSGHPPGC